ncbi:transcriptional regulator, PadR family [Subdoligranulum variabile DSM 15176]|uniref:Transcriptional regulator, PadR family n=2 Tax=Subdoligranulum variabile TaxID=214851 RepID=D1PPF6_9FIRM|nr:transcriptional regulator, PadR family [Subdoligranulum variabile DSM 15176]
MIFLHYTRKETAPASPAVRRGKGSCKKYGILLTKDILCGTMYTKEAGQMNLDDWKSQIKRGTLEFCILLMIRRQPSYGYEIISTLEKYPLLAAKENTIYPLLRRLLKEGWISSAWQESTEGLPPRKYYSLTAAGQEYLEAMSKEWSDLLAAVQEIKGV